MKGLFPRSATRASISACARDRGGVVLVLFALMLPIIIGFVGLGVETALWFAAKRSLQTAADAAAVAATYEVRKQSNSATILSKATADATRNGFSTTGGDTITLNMPPTTGSYTASTTAVEILLSRSVELLFSKILNVQSVTVNSRAVAKLNKSSEACVIALDPTANAAMTNIGTADITLDGCSVAVNSTHSTALSLSGASILTTECVSVTGGMSLGGSSYLTTTCAAPTTGARPVADPYSALSVPVIGPCDYDQLFVSSGTLSPGVYCHGINFGGTVFLDAGVYIIDRGSFRVNASAILTSNGGVTIILTSSTGAQYASVTINGGADVTMSAPTSGTYSGILFYGDRNSTSGINQILTGGATMDFTGALYFPVGDINYTGGATIGGSCTQIIGGTVTYNGTAKIKNDCPGSGMTSYDIYNDVGLVE